MVDFTRSATLAKRLIEKNGRDVTLYRRSRTAGNPAQPWRGPGANPSGAMGPVKVAFVPPRGTDLGKLYADEEGQLTVRVTQVGLLAADSVAALSPAPSELDVSKYEHVSDGGRGWRILEVEELRPASTTVLYVLVLNG